MTGATSQYAATATYADSTTGDVTSSVTWSSSEPGVATISTAGLATGVAAGSTTISANLSGITAPDDAIGELIRRNRGYLGT